MDKKYIERPKKFNKAEYNKVNYKQMKVEIKPGDYDLIDSYCKSNGISKAKFLVEASRFYIDNH